MKKIKFLIFIPFLIGNCFLSAKAFGEDRLNRIANEQTLKELTNRSNVLLLSNLVIRKNAIESYSSQKGNLVLNETFKRISFTMISSISGALLTGVVAGAVSNIKEENIDKTGKAFARGSILGAIFSIVAVQYNYEMIQNVETQQIRRLKSMSDEEIIQEYTSVISDIAGVSELLDNSVKN